jgi:hypothetical protein
VVFQTKPNQRNILGLKPWRKIAVPHEDAHNDAFAQTEFTADIIRVHDGSAMAEYQDPTPLFQRSFICVNPRFVATCPSPPGSVL